MKDANSTSPDIAQFMMQQQMMMQQLFMNPMMQQMNMMNPMMQQMQQQPPQVLPVPAVVAKAAETPSGPIILQPTSKDFTKFLSLLGFLKESDIFNSIEPRICLTCWVIICSDEVPKHVSADGKKHLATPNFKIMARADRKEFCKLAADQNRDKGSTFEVFNLSPKMVIFMLANCPKFADTYDYGKFVPRNSVK